MLPVAPGAMSGQQESGRFVENDQGVGGRHRGYRGDQLGGPGVLEGDGDVQGLARGDGLSQSGTGHQHRRLGHALPAQGGDGHLVGDAALNQGDIVVVVEFQLHTQRLVGRGNGAVGPDAQRHAAAFFAVDIIQHKRGGSPYNIQGVRGVKVATGERRRAPPRLRKVMVRSISCPASMGFSISLR